MYLSAERVVKERREAMVQYYEHEPAETIFEQAGIEYSTVKESPDNGAYRFIARWSGDPNMTETAVEEFGQYAAAIDLLVDSSQERRRLYRNIRSDGNRCYIPDIEVWGIDERSVEENTGQFELRNEGFYFLGEDFSTENEGQKRFTDAYDTAREQILSRLR